MITPLTEARMTDEEFAQKSTWPNGIEYTWAFIAEARRARAAEKALSESLRAAQAEAAHWKDVAETAQAALALTPESVADALLEAEIYARHLRRLVKRMRGTQTIRVWSADGIEEALRDTENFLASEDANLKAAVEAAKDAALAALAPRSEEEKTPESSLADDQLDVIYDVCVNVWDLFVKNQDFSPEEDERRFSEFYKDMLGVAVKHFKG